ncbi:hypothetical protein WA026_013883 [Henosepilachna vigintioctopunctata]|uniref:Nudix hydrolase domain-containing protein n=1 Tax=Henosepilachna vigintioctopunctata TaxID=420089 RepID=A0AAW1UB38_9CUCU
MFSIKNIKIDTSMVSKLNPVQLQFTENSTRRTWDLIETTDAVAIIIFNTSSNKLVALKKFEPAVYLTSISKEDRQSTIIDMLKYPENLGIVIELCGGNLRGNDEGHILEVAQISIYESTGYNVPRESIEFVSSFKSDVGPKCGNIYVYYCEVDEKMKVACSPKANEIVVEMAISEIKEYLGKSLPELRSSPIFLYAMLWFIQEKQTHE